MKVLVLAAAYLLGGLPFGYLLVRWRTGRDVRLQGSGNIGATNVQRTAGSVAGVLTLLLDSAKGFLAVWLASRVSHANPYWSSAAAVAVLLGHVYTPFLHFKGGKGVATFAGAFLFLTPPALLAVAVVFFGVVVFTRYISLGSIVGALTFPLGVWLIQQPAWPVLVASFLTCALVLYRHLDNIKRLHSGEERALSWRGRRA